ncbi:uncharacterized protein LOC113234854, partial [Hyposmocoma kahamanoa]|uniref:uncharacterized protein LOC113234854 n=1 Tax=Hyposmocoma kahamanoa TaxID=1477025 RepID=UPI000E6D98B3
KKNNHRDKRQVNGLPLIYPYGGTYKLLIGFTMPVKTTDFVNLYFTANFQYQYLQFTNVSALSRYYFIKEVSREQREVVMKNQRDERIVFYESLADWLNRQGVTGKQCVLRAICEAAQYPVEKEGLIGELIHILLTPDYGHLEDEDEDWKETMAVYIDAATAGRQMFSCLSIYSECPEGQGLMELVTKLGDQ